MISAGIVKITPAAIDEPAEAPVWTMLFSRMVPPPSSRSTPIDTTAAGMAVAMVRPANRPRYALAAARTIARMTASSTARKVNCRVAGWFICYPCPRKSNKLIAALGQVQCIRWRLAIRARTPYGAACRRRYRERASAGEDFLGHARGATHCFCSASSPQSRFRRRGDGYLRGIGEVHAAVLVDERFVRACTVVATPLLRRVTHGAK